MYFLRKILTNNEVKLTINELSLLNDFFKNEKGNDDNPFLYYAAWTIIYKQIEKRIYTNSKAISQNIKDNETTPNIIVLKFAFSSIFSEFRKGKYSIAGDLTLNGECLMKIFKVIMKKLLIAGVLKEDKTAEIFKELNETIKSSDPILFYPK